MSSTSPELSEAATRVIKAARVANASAMAKLAASFDKSLNGQTEWLWKHPLENPRHPNHFLSFEDLKNCVDSTPSPFWASILSDSVHLFKEHFPDIRVGWAALGVDEISEPQGTGAPNLGLKDLVVYHTGAVKPTNGFEFKYSISNPFLAARLQQLKSNSGNTIAYEQKGIGLCVTREKLSQRFLQMHFIHVDTTAKKFLTDKGDGVPHADIEALAAKILKENGSRGSLWDGYVQAFKPLTSSKLPIHCHLSATSLFHSLTNANAHAAAHLVFGFGDPPKREQAFLIYHAMQIMLSGLPALYSSMSQLRSETLVLRRYKQMVQLLERPLRGITDALAGMQSDTQRLRAILYEPSRALFDSHKVLSELFQEDGTLNASDNVKVILSHGNNYRDQGRSDRDMNSHEKRKGTVGDGKVVLAVALMRILGRAHELKDRQSRFLIVQKAVQILHECTVDPIFRELIADIRWLFKLQDTSIASLFGNPSIHLTTLKRVLFDPFKLETRDWDKRALLLATRPYHRKAIANPGLSLVTFGDGISPVPYNAVLSFMSEISAAICRSKADAKVSKVELQSSGNIISCKVAFDHPGITIYDRLPGLRKLINDFVLPQPPEWRTTDADVGDFRKPFVDLANRLLGLTANTTGWSPRPMSELTSNKQKWEIFAVCRNEDLFRVGFAGSSTQGHDVVFLDWVSNSARHTVKHVKHGNTLKAKSKRGMARKLRVVP